MYSVVDVDVREYWCPSDHTKKTREIYKIGIERTEIPDAML